MNGAKLKSSANLQARSRMRLRGIASDASNLKPGWQAFSDFVAPLIRSAVLQARHLVQVVSMSQHQRPTLCTNTCALTSGSSGAANTALRYAFAAH